MVVQLLLRAEAASRARMNQLRLPQPVIRHLVFPSLSVPRRLTKAMVVRRRNTRNSQSERLSIQLSQASSPVRPSERTSLLLATLLLLLLPLLLVAEVPVALLASLTRRPSPTRSRRLKSVPWPVILKPLVSMDKGQRTETAEHLEVRARDSTRCFKACRWVPRLVIELDIKIPQCRHRSKSLRLIMRVCRRLWLCCEVVRPFHLSSPPLRPRRLARDLRLYRHRMQRALLLLLD